MGARSSRRAYVGPSLAGQHETVVTDGSAGNGLRSPLGARPSRCLIGGVISSRPQTGRWPGLGRPNPGRSRPADMLARPGQAADPLHVSIGGLRAPSHQSLTTDAPRTTDGLSAHTPSCRTDWARRRLVVFRWRYAVLRPSWTGQSLRERHA